jgi:hypothetical protein
LTNRSLDSIVVVANIPYEAEVRVIKPWNGVRYNVGSSLLTQYYIWSQAEAVNDIENKIRRARLHDRKHKNCSHRWPEKIDWIERLLNKPLDDYRECCVVFILVPYLMNIRKLSHLETYNIIRRCLDRCNSLDPLRFDADYKINYTIDRVGEILPQSRHNLECKRNRL